jgi:hypothetical protein
VNNSFQEVSSYARLVNESRYTNIAICFNVQSVVGIPQLIREAASIVICKRLNDKRECDTIAQMMNFSSYEQKEMMMKLGIQDAIFINKEKGAIPVHILIPEYK